MYRKWNDIGVQCEKTNVKCDLPYGSGFGRGHLLDVTNSLASEPEVSSTYSQEPATGPYAESTPHLLSQSSF
jgi:hypothetical protein